MFGTINDNPSKRAFILAIRVCLTVGFLILLVRQMDWSLVYQIITRYGIRLYLGLVPITTLGWFMYVLRWRFLLFPLGVTPSFSELTVDSLIGLFYGLFIPSGLAGDAVRAVRLGGRHSKVREVLLSVAIDRLVGLFSVVILFVIQLVRERGGWRSIRLPWMEWLIGASFVVGVILLSRYLTGTKYRIDSLLKHWPLNLLIHQVRQFWCLIKRYDRARYSIISSVIISIGYQLLVTLTYYVGSMMLGIDVSFGDYVWIVALVTMAQVLPITIAGLGVREGVFAFLLKRYDVASARAVALPLIIFSITVFFGVLGGILELTNIYPSPVGE